MGRVRRFLLVLLPLSLTPPLLLAVSLPAEVLLRTVARPFCPPGTVDVVQSQAEVFGPGYSVELSCVLADGSSRQVHPLLPFGLQLLVLWAAFLLLAAVAVGVLRAVLRRRARSAP